MKTVTHNPQQLVLEQTPWLLGAGVVAMVLLFVAIGIIVPAISGMEMGWLFGVMFAGVGGGLWGLMLFVFVRKRQLVLDRSGNAMILRVRSMAGFKEERFDLDRLRHATLEETDGDGGQRMTRPALVLASRRRGGAVQMVPVHSYFTTTQAPGRAVEVINGWLEETGLGDFAESAEAQDSPTAT